MSVIIGIEVSKTCDCGCAPLPLERCVTACKDCNGSGVVRTLYTLEQLAEELKPILDALLEE